MTVLEISVNGQLAHYGETAHEVELAEEVRSLHSGWKAKEIEEATHIPISHSRSHHLII